MKAECHSTSTDEHANDVRQAIDEYIGGSVGPNVTALKRSSIALFDADPTASPRNGTRGSRCLLPTCLPAA